MKLFDLTGKTALVTGGTGWLGRAFCEALAEAGASVVVTSRDQTRADQVANELSTEQGQSHFGIALDHMAANSLADSFQHALELAGPIDTLVNNGLELAGGDLRDISFDAFARHQVNNAGYFELARLVHDHVVARSAPASIVNIGSMYGQVGSYPDSYQDVCNASSVAYHTLKGGTIHMTRHLAVYWAEDNVRVNCLSPGPFPNPATAPAELIQRLNEKSPLKRLGEPHELKGAIVFLAGDASSYVTGHNLIVDGGWTAW
jgi:gluconate 5-dehydrogenase